LKNSASIHLPQVWVSENQQATLLDPYAGVSTTGVAAIQLGRRYVGIELDPKYMREAIRRLELAIEAAKRTQLELPKAPPKQMAIGGIDHAE